MISEAVNTFLDAISSRFFGVIHLVTDPFWGWLVVVILATLAITAVEIAVRFYFADLPWFRKIGGLAIIGMIIALFSYRKGEKDNQERQPKPKPPPPPPQRRWQ